MGNITFTFFGRYDHEKGITILLQAIEELSLEPKSFSKMEFNFFGKGSYIEKIKALSKKFPNIKEHGRKDRNHIIDFLKNKTDYTIMPSVFLETFGKTFLESCEIGVPVIGLKKGGSASFIHENLDINAENNEKIKERLITIIKKILSNDGSYNRKIYHQRSLNKAKNFSQQVRIDNFYSFFPEYNLGKSKILLISDYNSNLGGIEKYLQDTQKILIHQGINTKIFGRPLPTGRYTKFLKGLYLCLSGLNIVYFVQLYMILLKEKASHLWFHSTLRVIGRFPIYFLSKKQKILVTYHDLGYFHPFPSLVEQESQIPSEFSLKSFLSEAKNKSLLIKGLVILKFFSLKLIKNQLLRKADYHIVPSDFMVKFLEKQRKVPKEKIIVFPHCSIQ